MNGNITIAISNNKGGVGKTTLSVMIAETLLKRTDKRICAIDLDPQRNFADTLSLIDSTKYGERLIVNAGDIKTNGEINVIDCPPAINDATIEAIRVSDVVLIPIMADMYSLVNIGNVFSAGERAGKKRAQMPLVTIGFNNTSTSILNEIKTYIETNEYVIIANIPFNKLIPFNILTGQMWDYGVTMNHRRVVYKLLENIGGGLIAS
jgi:cellulose biosynthesis protein BcsQ